MKKVQIVFSGFTLALLLFLTGCFTSVGPTPIDVTFESAIQTGGASNTADSTGLTLTFNLDPVTLEASDITVIGATKGALSGAGTTKTLAISNITVANGETVSVAIADPSGFSISGSPITAVVYKERIYNLRDTGPAGGLIFYINSNYQNDGWRYLEAAPNTWNDGMADPLIVWQDSILVIGASSKEIGTGIFNTERIVNWSNINGYSGCAAQVVDSLSFGGYNDWFLPSIDELGQMRSNLKDQGVGGFVDENYWSSSEENMLPWSQYHAWIINFDTGGSVFHDSKSTARRVRPVRAF